MMRFRYVCRYNTLPQVIRSVCLCVSVTEFLMWPAWSGLSQGEAAVSCPSVTTPLRRCKRGAGCHQVAKTTSC
eukprot:11994-Eustigmatos_ZCMA.PRE.1